MFLFLLYPVSKVSEVKRSEMNICVPGTDSVYPHIYPLSLSLYIYIYIYTHTKDGTESSLSSCPESTGSLNYLVLSVPILYHFGQVL